MNKGKTTIIVLVIFMVLAVVIGGVYAFYSSNQKEKTDLAALIASMEKEINKNVETITQLEQTLELNGLELEDLIKKEVEYKTLIDDRTKTQKQYIERKEYITRTLTDKKTIYNTKIQEKTRIEKEIETLTETLENTNPSDVETITEIQEKIVEKEKENVVVEQEIQEVEKVIVEYEKELVEVEERINVLTININQLNETITELNVSINLIGKTEEETRELVKSLEDENAALSEELAYAKAEIENLKANAEAKYQNIIDNLNSDISNLQSRLTATENELNSYKEANISLQQTIINLENEIENIVSQNNSLLIEKENLIAINKEISEINKQLELENNNLKNNPIIVYEKFLIQQSYRSEIGFVTMFVESDGFGIKGRNLNEDFYFKVFYNEEGTGYTMDLYEILFFCKGDDYFQMFIVNNSSDFSGCYVRFSLDSLNFTDGFIVDSAFKDKFFEVDVGSSHWDYGTLLGVYKNC